MVVPGTAQSSGNAPTVAPITGNVTFTPNVTEADSALLDTTIFLPPIPAILNTSGILCTPDGTVHVQLIDSLYLNLGDTPLLYYVQYSSLNSPGTLNSFWFAAPGNGAAVDLNTVTRVPPSGQIVPGPTGD
jgi:hypothetical protein